MSGYNDSEGPYTNGATGVFTHLSHLTHITNKFDKDATPADGDVWTYDSVSGVYAPQTPGSTGDVANIKNYGAVGNGTTDDSTAIIAARNAVLNSRTGGVPQIPILYFPPGVYRVTQPDALYPAGATRINGYTIRGAGPEVSCLKFDPTGGSSTLTNMNLITTTGATPHLYQTRIESMRVESTNANASFAYLFSTGSHWNANWIVKDVQFIGDWKRVFGLDGDSSASLNSEMRFHNVAFNDTTTFADAFFHSGITSPATNSQQDQFLNYRFQDCDLTFESGDCLVFERGGQIAIDGGSWIMVGAAGGTFITLGGASYFHSDATQQLSVRNVRAELRNANTVFIDNAWSSGSITFENFSDEAQGNLYQVNGTGAGLTNYATHIYRTPQDFGPTVRYQDCALMGYHQIVTTASVPTGKQIYNGCNFRNMQSGGVSLLSTATSEFLRYDSAVPHYRFQDCVNTTDVNA